MSYADVNLRSVARRRVSASTMALYDQSELGAIPMDGTLRLVPEPTVVVSLLLGLIPALRRRRACR